MLYRNLHQLSATVRTSGKPKSKSVTSYRTPIGLSVNLAQTLQKSLYLGFGQYASRDQHNTALNYYDTARPYFSGLRKTAPSSPSRPCVFVRHVRMLFGESIGHTFTPENGLIPEPSLQGRMLLLTNRRVIAFGRKAGVRETVIVPLEEIKVVAVNAGQRSKGTLFQGGIMIVAAVLLYVMLAYWLTGRVDSLQLPIIRMDLLAFVAFLAVLTGVAVLAQMYFAKPDGEVMFQGDGVKVTFPFRGKTSEDEMYVLVNAVFASRQEIVK